MSPGGSIMCSNVTDIRWALYVVEIVRVWDTTPVQLSIHFADVLHHFGDVNREVKKRDGEHLLFIHLFGFFSRRAASTYVRT